VLHVRIASPPALTERLLQALTTDGVEDLVVLPARWPDGDVVQFDLPRGSANPVSSGCAIRSWQACARS
jgi:hypothetical protein